jgi:hypothetical protein
MTTLETVEIGEMERSEAAELFFKYSKIKSNRPDVHAEVGQIVGELGHLAFGHHAGRDCTWRRHRDYV